MNSPPIRTEALESADTATPMAARSTSLLRSDFARERFTTAIFADSHGALGDYLGAGFLYYGFAAALRSQVSVCIGSGGGFVPDLLAQAQHDLDVTPAATYLIDANLGELGYGSPTQPGGWLRSESPFRQRAGDVQILTMLSSDAARLFARQAITIDYLHIDGDHSTRGVLADLDDYLPMLAADAVISLHDFNLPSVRRALAEFHRLKPEWHSLELPDLGAGTAFLRRAALPFSADRQPSTGRTVDRDRKVLIEREDMAQSVAESMDKTRFERWHYLKTSAYQARYRLVAEHIDRPGGTIVEIGGFPNSIVPFVADAKRVIALEPYAPPDYLAALEAEAARRMLDFKLVPGSIAMEARAFDDVGDFALVWLGLDLSAACDTAEEFLVSLEALLSLAHRARVVAMEFPDHVPSMLVWRLIQELLAPEIVSDIVLDLSADPVGLEYSITDGRAKRKIVVFRAKGRPEPGQSALVALCAERLERIKRRSVPAEPGSPASQPGYSFAAAELPAGLGDSPDGVERVATPARDKPGCFTYGPYIRLPEGRYRLRWTYSSPSGPSTAAGSWDLCVGAKTVLAKGLLPGTDDKSGTVEGIFDLSRDDSQHPVEARAFFQGVVELRLRELTIERVEVSAPTV